MIRKTLSAVAKPLFCDPDTGRYWYYTVAADYLLVHTTPGATTPSVGQVPRNSVFCARTGGTYIKTISGVDYRYGYGHNGSKKLTGWVALKYLAS